MKCFTHHCLSGQDHQAVSTSLAPVASALAAPSLAAPSLAAPSLASPSLASPSTGLDFSQITFTTGFK